MSWDESLTLLRHCTQVNPSPRQLIKRQRMSNVVEGHCLLSTKFMVDDSTNKRVLSSETKAVARERQCLVGFNRRTRCVHSRWKGIPQIRCCGCQSLTSILLPPQPRQEEGVWGEGERPRRRDTSSGAGTFVPRRSHLSNVKYLPMLMKL